MGQYDALSSDDKLVLEMYHQWCQSPVANQADALAAVFIVHGIPRPSAQASYVYDQLCGIDALLTRYNALDWESWTQTEIDAAKEEAMRMAKAIGWLC
jgi:hypothetical protein